MTKRREFIKTSAYVAAASLILPATACTTGSKKEETAEAPSEAAPVAAAGKMGVGIQIYSVRNQLKEDFAGTLKKVAEIGYDLIEAYGLGLDGKFLGQHTAADVRKMIDDLGMKLIATHCGYFKPEDASKMIDAAKAAGLEYLIVPGIPHSETPDLDGWKNVADVFNKVGEQCSAAGLKFGFHNHAGEFKEVEGQIPMDILISGTDADKVCFEADLFWVTKGGHDPVELIKKYPGRIKLFHVKDMAEDGEGTTVGQGNIDFKTIFEVGKQNGLENYFIEDERTDDPFANIKADYDYISKQSFA